MVHEIEATVGAVERGAIGRREAVRRLTALVAALAGARAASAESGSTSTFRARGLNHLALRVREVPPARDFYVEHLGLSVLRESSRNCFLRCGDDNFVALFQGTAPGMDHYCYTVEDYRPGRAVDTLRAAGLSPRREENRVYFEDADGLTVQLSGPRDAWPG